MCGVGSDGFLEGRESDRVEDGNDRRDARRVCKTKTATAESAAETPNVSRRSIARAVEMSRSIFGKWGPFRRCRSKRERASRERPQRKATPKEKITKEKLGRRKRCQVGRFQIGRLGRGRSQSKKRFRQRRGDGRGDR